MHKTSAIHQTETSRVKKHTKHTKPFGTHEDCVDVKNSLIDQIFTFQ